MRTTDEDGHTSITYTDNQDREVLSVQTDGSTRLETYKVYDDRGLLRWVLSPEASAQLDSTTDSDVLERLAYNYAYDARKRMTLKRLPGCAPIYMVYDSRDRLVLSQDGEERADNPNRWSYLQYDMQGRVVETGELVLSQAQSHEELQRAASKVENYLPSGTRTALQYTDYDSYPSECSPFQATAGYSESYNAYPIGQVTSVKSRRLATDEWETVTTYYDDYARPIQAITAKGQTKTSRVYTEYDFLGNVVKQQETQSDGTSLETVNTYDSRSRLLSSVTTKNKVETSVVKYGYDAVGRLVEKRYGNTVEKLGYNIRGWLISKESAAFKMRLRYEQPEGGATACYNGNISEWEWSHGTNPILMYSFAYDSFGRLASANQQQASGNGWAELAANYVEKGITYDRNGNIRTLQRTAAGNPVDDLIYGYRGNRLVSLSEQVCTSQVGDVYLPGNTASGMYEYDSNGNLTKDSRKGLEYKYNRLNLLEEVWKDGEMKAQYNYLADGTKLGVRDGSGKTGYDYVGSVVYKVVDGRREFDRAVVGDVHFTAKGARYALTDQLGSVRALIDEDGNVAQQNDYYPFGAKVARDDYADSDDNRFLFSGKESQELLDLNAYDFGARMYDASLGRWNMVDPLGEYTYNETCYNYSSNNPIVFVDIDGQLKDWYYNQDGDMVYDPFVTGPSDLLEGEKYVGISLKKKGVYYRKDGSILYSKESQAYERIWNMANKFGVEIGGFLLDTGEVLVLPDFRNERDDATPSKYGYEVHNGILTNMDKEKWNILSQIHTHQDVELDASPSIYDIYFSKSMGGFPIVVIGHDGIVRWARYDLNQQASGNGTLGSMEDLMNGVFQLFGLLK